MMALQQLMTLPKFTPPTRVTSSDAAEIFINDRIVFIIQYPERLYEIRDQYQQFENITCATEEFQIALPPPILENKPSGYFPHFPVPTIRPYD